MLISERLRRSGILRAEAGQRATAPFPAPLSPLAVSSPTLRSGQVSLDEGEHYPAQSKCQRRYAPTVFGFTPECRSDSIRNMRSASPESPVRGKEGQHCAHPAGEADAERTHRKFQRTFP